MLSFACRKPMRACAIATRRSQAMASSAPPPSASPLTRDDRNGKAADRIESRARARREGDRVCLATQQFEFLQVAA